MAVYYNQDVSYIIGGYEVACNAKSATLATTVAPLDTTAVCTTSGYTTLIGGNKSGQFNLELMADMATLGLDDFMWSYLSTADVVHQLSIGSADGSPAYLWRGITTNYTPIQGNPGELAMSSLSGQSSTGPVIRGQRIHPTSVARSATGNGTAYQLGAVVAGKSLYAALNVIARTGTASMTLKIQSDDNSGMSSPTDRITSFTAATGTGYQWGSVAGAITDDYWRCVYTITGTGTITFAVAAGII